MRRIVNRLFKRVSTQFVVVDTSFLMDIRALPTAEANEIGQWVVSNGVVDELAEHINHGDAVKKQRGEAALSLIDSLSRDKKLSFVSDIGDHGVDDSLVAVASANRFPLLSLDYEMRQKARKLGVNLYSLKRINKLGLPINEGDEIMVSIDRRGRRRHQGVADHYMGTVFVDNAGPIGQKQKVSIRRISFQGVSVIIFAVPYS